MTFRISQFAAACSFGLLTMAGAMSGQAPRYQSPYAAPAVSQPIALPPATPIQPNATVVEDIIVRVNDQIISRSDLERSAQQLVQEIQQNNVPPTDAAEQQKNMLRDMIDKQLMLSRAKELGLSADAEVVRRLDDIRKQNKMDSMEDLEKAARQQGISFEDFKANIRDGILEQQVVRDEVGRRLQMTQGQEQVYYNAHKQEFEQPEQVRLSEILIPVAADAKDDALAQAQAKADDIESKLKLGQKFEELAKTYSGGPSAAQGGDLGAPFKRGAMAKVFDDQTFSLQAGGVTTPIRTRQGFVILKVTEHQAAGVPPMKDVEQQIQEAMYLEQLQPALRAYLTKLRESAYIDIKPGFLDTGASVKQTKPVFTAYAPPVVKKKKVQEKERFDRGGRFSAASSKGSTKGVAAPATSAGGLQTSAGDAPPTAAGEGSAATSTDTAPTAAPSSVVAIPAKTVKTAVNSKATKPKKIKREKVRFGQAPRNSLPAAPSDALVDKGLGRPDAIGPGESLAPGAVIAPTESTTTFSASSDPDPLAEKAQVTGKTRYSARAKTEAATKAAAKAAKTNEKAAATPLAASAEEKQSDAVQAAPLGLNGDTSKKKKQKVRGAPKERIQQKAPEPAAVAPEATPYRRPAPETAPATTPSSDSTTLPPVTAPAPGASPNGNIAPATPGNPIPTPAPN